MIDFTLAESINTKINESTCYMSDLERVGNVEFWDVALGEGDCEDYALAKRAALIEAGHNVTDLHMAVCTVETGGRHAVLIVVTNQGDYVLDNRYPDPMMKQYLPYSDWSIEVCGKWHSVL